MTIFWKKCRDRKYNLLWWVVGITAYMLMMGWYYPSISEQKEAMEALLESFPDTMWTLLGLDGTIDMMSGSGFLTVEAFSIMLPICFSIFAMGIGSRSIAGEETDGTLEILAAMPVSRGQIFIENFLALLVLMATLGACLWVSVLIASRWGDMGITYLPISGGTLMVSLLGLFFGTLTLTAGAITGRRGQTIAIGTAAIVVAYALNTLAKTITSLSVIRWLSPFHYYTEGLSLNQNVQFTDALPLIIGISALAWIGFYIFKRRDIK